MKNKDNIDMDMLDEMSRSKRIKIATKIEKRINNEIGEYHTSKNNDYRKVIEEVAAEYEMTTNEALLLYCGWEAYKKLDKPK